MTAPEQSVSLQEIDACLFAAGRTVADYWIENGAVVCFKDANGRAFDLRVREPMADAVLLRLHELDVRTVEL